MNLTNRYKKKKRICKLSNDKSLQNPHSHLMRRKGAYLISLFDYFAYLIIAAAQSTHPDNEAYLL